MTYFYSTIPSSLRENPMNAPPSRHINIPVATRYLVALTPVFASIPLLVDVSTSGVLYTFVYNIIILY